jgi:diaminopimelate decarboxylase
MVKTTHADVASRPGIGWQEGAFCIEGLPLAQLTEKVPTPFYVTALSAFEQRLKLYQSHLRQAFPRSRVFYALKANSGLPLVKCVSDVGEGFDIVSRGELEHLLRAGVDPARICYAGVGKSPEEIAAAIQSSVGVLNVEHIGELRQAMGLMVETHAKTRIALRLNPCIDVETHPHLRTGALDSKFGMLEGEILGFFDSDAGKALLAAKDSTGAVLGQAIAGIHVHVGSQLLTGKLFEAVVNAATQLALALMERGLVISHLDFGGGLGVGLHGVPHDGSDIANHVLGLRDALVGACQQDSRLIAAWGKDLSRVEVCLEPGRSMVASSTVFVTRALYTRTNHADHRFVYVDGGMNDFPRPAIYGAKHAVTVAMRGNQSLGEQAVVGGTGLQIVGPVCESGDVLRKDPSLKEIEHVAPGDTLVFFEAGAYCRSMASEYNLRPLPQTIYVCAGKVV